MGFIKGGIIFILGVLLFLSFLVGNFFLTFGLALSFDNIEGSIQPIVSEVAEDIDFKDEIDEEYEQAEEFCLENSEYVFDLSEVNLEEYGLESDITSEGLTVSCETILENPGNSEVIMDSAVEELSEDFYYKDYDCDFIDCFEEQDVPLFLVSEKSKDYLMNKFYVSLVVSLVLIGLILLFLESRMNIFIIVGALLAVSALPFVGLVDLIRLFTVNSSVLEILEILFVGSSKISWIIFILGIIILAFGIVLKFFNIGYSLGMSTGDAKAKPSSSSGVKMSKSKRNRIIALEKKISQDKKNLNKK